MQYSQYDFVRHSGVRSARTAAEIARCVRDEIRQGTLAAGTSLPTVRDLADEIGVHRNTVTAAYRQLAESGILKTGRRRGTIVSASALLPPLSGKIPEGVHNLANGNPDPDLLPDLRKWMAELRLERQLYDGPVRLPELVALAQREFAEAGLKGGEIAIASGAMDAFERALSVRLMPGDSVAIEEPCFPSTLSLLSALKLTAVPVSVDTEGMRPDLLYKALQGNVRAVIVTPRAHNPTGVSLSIARAAELRRVLANAPDILVLEDDYFNGLALAPPVWVGGPERAHWLAVRSLSKCFGPDVRISMLIGDPAMIGLIENRQRLGQRWVSHILQRLAYDLLVDTTVAQLLERARTAYAHRRETLIAGLKGIGFDAMGADGLNVWLPTLYDQQIAQSLSLRCWMVRSSPAFSKGQQPGVRVSIGQLPDNRIHDFVRDLAECVAPGNGGGGA